jgi:hypothetical protein
MIYARTLQLKDIPEDTIRSIELDVNVIKDMYERPDATLLGTVVYVNKGVLASILVSVWKHKIRALRIVKYIVVDAFSNYGIEQDAVLSLNDYMRWNQIPFTGHIEFITWGGMTESEYWSFVNLVSVVNKRKADSMTESYYEERLKTGRRP